MRASKIMSETKETVVTFDAGDLHVTYRPNAYTPRKTDAIQKAMADPSTQSAGLVQMVQDIMVRWDLEDDDGVTIPLDDADALRDVGSGIFGAIFEKIGKDAQTGKAPTVS